jgi:aldose sugar dehydrogenase
MEFNMRVSLMVIAAIPLLLIVILAVFFILAPQNTSVNETGFGTEVIAQNLEVPWALAFLPDDRMIFTERGGKVNILEGQNVKNVGTINVTQNTESGLLGIAVDPHFNENHYIYLYYTKGNYNRISRFILTDTLANETVLVDNIPAASIHNGGRLKFGPDGKLYATTGEAGNTALAQDLNSLGGKILRFNTDGSIPSDNPFGTYVYSYGHRDPQGIAWGPTGIMYASEHGASSNDELNIIIKGGNYGWPLYQGNNTASGYIKPLRGYTEFTLAPSGIAFYQKAVWIAGLRGTQLRKVTLSDDGNLVMGEKAFFRELGRIRDVVEYKGYLYISTSNRDGRGIPQTGDDKILKIKIS